MEKNPTATEIEVETKRRADEFHEQAVAPFLQPLVDRATEIVGEFVDDDGKPLVEEGPTTYFLYKQGIGGHGVYWIGDDLEEGKWEADRAASADRDDYHDWNLCVYTHPGADTDYASGDGYGENANVVYVGVKENPSEG